MPSLNFDAHAYLAANPDVKAARRRSARAFPRSSAAEEGRQPIAPTELIASNGFDYVYYLQHNPDVAAAHVDPFQHFQTVGWKEGRNPNALFDTNGYLATYADVQAAHVNPLDHYNHVRLARGARSLGQLRHDRLSRRLCRRGRGAHQSAHALPAVRHSRRPLGLRGRPLRVGDRSQTRYSELSERAGSQARAKYQTCREMNEHGSSTATAAQV